MKICRALLNILLSAAAVLLTGQAGAYPLDGRDYSGIRRLTGYQTAQAQPAGPRLPPGALLAWRDIDIHLNGAGKDTDFDSVPVQDELQHSLDSIFSSRDPSYSAVVIDITDPDNISWAALRPDIRQNVGSVGKILCMLALFDALARAFPDTGVRARVLRETLVHAGDWVNFDEHQVPIFSGETATNRSSVVRSEDDFYLSEWLDHMISASANAAATVVWREAMLLRQFGSSYPVGYEKSEEFFRNTSKAQLLELSQKVINDPLVASGINPGDFQQGSFWTPAAKTRIPGIQSFATTRELARYMLRLEQGRLVDAWSSREMKRYLYMTKRRYRYVYAPELAQSAVYFKSGSLYACQPEEGFRCGKYMGNKRNYMNSVVIIESPPGAVRQYRYIVALISNVLRINSAWDHSRLGAAIHEAVLNRGRITVQEVGTPDRIRDAGKD